MAVLDAGIFSTLVYRIKNYDKFSELGVWVKQVSQSTQLHVYVAITNRRKETS